MNELIKVIKALTDPSRIRIVAMLGVKDMCVCEMQHALELAQPTVSRHLRILEEAGLVSKRKRGLWVDYRLAKAEPTTVAGKMLALVAESAAQDMELSELIERVPGINRSNLQGLQLPVPDGACCAAEVAKDPEVIGA